MSADELSAIPSLVCAAVKKKNLAHGMQVSFDEICCGKVKVSRLILRENDFDWRGLIKAHVVYDLFEFMVLAAAISVGAEVEALNFSCNIVKYTNATKVYAVSKVCHHGRLTIVTETKMYDENDTLLASSLTTLFVVGQLDNIPRKW